ncbi:hypothetical protein BaRGS_00003250 [Batillaria attramentaria]|uniref:Protein kinase domain-containing protein n=1 Tax=Batillaria attramentaria TaxID=370345 RepID=A0ABD0M0R0_9CAEN
MLLTSDTTREHTEEVLAVKAAYMQRTSRGHTHGFHLHNIIHARERLPISGFCHVPEEQFNNELNAVLEPPRRVYLETDESKLKPDVFGDYTEGVNYEKEKELKGGSSMATVSVIKDKATGTYLVKKEMQKSDCRKEAIEAHKTLQAGSSSFPRLRLVKENGDRVSLYMDLVLDGKTMRELQELLGSKRVSGKSALLVRQLGLCILHKLLSVIKYMHDNKFSHQDITDRNILVRMSNMQLAVIDLESAVKLWPDAASGMADPKGKSEGLIDVDFNDAYMIFCALYTAGNNTDIHQLESELRKGRSKRLADGYEVLSDIPEAEKRGTLKLLTCCQEVVRQNSGSYGNPQSAMYDIEDLILPEVYGEVVFWCFLTVLHDFNGRVSAMLKDQLSGGDNKERRSLKAILDMARRNLRQALRPQEFVQIARKLQGWGVISDKSEVQESDDSFSQLLGLLHDAVTTQNRDRRFYERLPANVRENIDKSLRVEERMSAVMQRAMELLSLIENVAGDNDVRAAGAAFGRNADHEQPTGEANDFQTAPPQHAREPSTRQHLVYASAHSTEYTMYTYSQGPGTAHQHQPPVQQPVQAVSATVPVPATSTGAGGAGVTRQPPQPHRPARLVSPERAAPSVVTDRPAAAQANQPLPLPGQAPSAAATEPADCSLASDEKPEDAEQPEESGEIHPQPQDTVESEGPLGVRKTH